MNICEICASVPCPVLFKILLSALLYPWRAARHHGRPRRSCAAARPTASVAAAGRAVLLCDRGQQQLHITGTAAAALDGLALVEPLGEHVDGLVQMMDGHLEAGPAQAAGQRSDALLLVHLALDDVVDGAEGALEALGQGGPLLGLDLLRIIVSSNHCVRQVVDAKNTVSEVTREGGTCYAEFVGHHAAAEILTGAFFARRPML